MKHLCRLLINTRNWKNLTFFKADKDTKYKNIDSLFSDTIDWNLLETHWQDLLQVAISIKEGKISSMTLLRKLTNNSGKNRLYKAFQELGQVIRTIFY
jgi:TnpA family transposase